MLTNALKHVNPHKLARYCLAGFALAAAIENFRVGAREGALLALIVALGAYLSAEKKRQLRFYSANMLNVCFCLSTFCGSVLFGYLFAKAGNWIGLIWFVLVAVNAVLDAMHEYVCIRVNRDPAFAALVRKEAKQNG